MRELSALHMLIKLALFWSSVPIAILKWHGLLVRSPATPKRWIWMDVMRCRMAALCFLFLHLPPFLVLAGPSGTHVSWRLEAMEKVECYMEPGTIY
jgi:hypothetical protein